MHIGSSPAYFFNAEIEKTLHERCSDTERYATENPLVHLASLDVHGGVVLASFWIGGFFADSTQQSKDDRKGGLFWQLDGGVGNIVYDFPTGTSKMIVAWKGLTLGQHRLIYGLRSARGVVAYGQRCFSV